MTDQHSTQSGSDRLGEWLRRVVGTASTTRSAQMTIEMLVANAAAGRVENRDRYHAALEQIAALPGHSAEWQTIAKEALMTDTQTTPLVLVDQPEDDACDTRGWVEASVTEDEARDLLAPSCADVDGDLGYRPSGPAEKVWLKAHPQEPELWITAEAGEAGAVEFWQVVID